jgi:hypothetical protein
MEYRFKNYWDNGNVTFDTVKCSEKIALASARDETRYYKTIKKVDVYQGTKLIATFYK